MVMPGDPRRVFPTSIVTSQIDANLLPYHMTPGKQTMMWGFAGQGTAESQTAKPDAQILCDVESDLSLADEARFREKNQHFWERARGGKRHYQIDYQVKVLLGPADIRFELCKFSALKMKKDSFFFGISQWPCLFCSDESEILPRFPRSEVEQRSTDQG